MGKHGSDRKDGWTMTRKRFYSIAMPLAGILYVIALILTHNGKVATVGASLFVVIATPH
jgi:hypothetical protein